MKNTLLKKIHDHTCHVGIIGLGYVGLPLLLEFNRKGFPVTGFDIDINKVKSLTAGKSYIRHIDATRIKAAFCRREGTRATTEFKWLRRCDAIIICVPTPLTKNREPDMSYIVSTGKAMAPYIRKGQLISLESTTYPGTTDEVLIPILEQAGNLKAGRDFMVAFSPEREDPSNPQFSTSTIPKVVGGFDAASGKAACALYGSVVCKTIPVHDCKTAEATKLMENIFRSVNIALVNELKLVFTAMGISIWDVVNAASTKPFGYMPFYPGPGLGGHCIPIDPFYLTWKAREFGLSTRFIELAGEINTTMPEYVIRRTQEALNNRNKAMRGSRILLVGLAYKKNVDDTRESPTYELMRLLETHGARVAYYDPICPQIGPSREHMQFAGRRSRTWKQIAKDRYDAAIIATAHDSVDHNALARMIPLIIDTRGVCKDRRNVVRA